MRIIDVSLKGGFLSLGSAREEEEIHPPQHCHPKTEGAGEAGGYSGGKKIPERVACSDGVNTLTRTWWQKRAVTVCEPLW